MQINCMGKCVGELLDSIYITYRMPMHFFRKFHGFGVSKSVLAELQIRGCTRIVFHYEGAGNYMYKISFGDFLQNGKFYSHKVDGVTDDQIACDIKYMKEFKNG